MADDEPITIYFYSRVCVYRRFIDRMTEIQKDRKTERQNDRMIQNRKQTNRKKDICIDL